ncbi:DUF4827 domain-containing protein [Hoylesella loescheii]|jgi:hypothetical protein|uniref:DUF4827 domain-containing protein n=1 Tax=Hoylesella loescheii TaxID=840 RepID=UPI0026EBDB7A|nr:DUF4827 domain-containing protein [Hoylesella loescheii]
MKKLLFSLFLLAGALLWQSCSRYETYADKVKTERNAINNYITKKKIKVISETEFMTNGESTDIAKNEYVLFESSGVYMQIVHKGAGKKLEKGQRMDVVCRFSERNLLTDSIELSSFHPRFAAWVDKMSVTNTSGTFTASFNSNNGLMYRARQRTNGTSVPSGWLTPFTYILLDRLSASKDAGARVRLIVPHDRGHGAAINGVIPYFYELELSKAK